MAIRCEMYVYILQSKKNNRFYVGTAANIEERLVQHNRGENESTKAYGPWEIVKFEEYKDKRLALKREKFLKSGTGRRVLQHLLKRNIKEVAQLDRY